MRVSLTQESITRLGALAPDFASLGNPIDLTAALAQTEPQFSEATHHVIEDPNIDLTILRSYPGRDVKVWAENLIAYQKLLRRRDLSLTHTIIHPTIDKSTDGQFAGNRVPVHKVGETAGGIVVRGARILATLAPFADEIAVYPGHPLAPDATPPYALAFSISMDTPGLMAAKISSCA